jgi:predicted peptidase
MLFRLAVSVASVAFLIHSQAVLGEEPQSGRQVEQMFQSKSDPAMKLGYLLYLPENYGKSSEKSPLLLFLHGSGERGNDLSAVKKHGPPKLIGQGQQFPFVVVSPQCPADQRWDAKTLLALLDDLGAKYSIDASRIYVTGLSMGGSGTWSLVAAAPQRFAAAVPICGGADPKIVEAVSSVPTWIVVGDRDRDMLVANCRVMAGQLQSRGADVKFTLYTGVGHDSWTQTYATPELYEWMLRRQRPN